MIPRRALVTGASSDIGAATARILAQEGSAVWLTYNQAQKKAEEVARQCRELGAQVRLSQLDLRSTTSIQQLVELLTDDWGGLEVLVNNASVAPFTALESISVDDWDSVMETNARGTFLLTRAILPLMQRPTAMESQDRSIVNISSISGEIGALKAGIHFAASKAAILAITRSFARLLLKDGIRVNAVCPGQIDTGMIDHIPETRKRELSSAVPVGRFGTAEEVAWIVSCLTSPQASFVTGATYDVNGGGRIA